MRGIVYALRGASRPGLSKSVLDCETSECGLCTLDEASVEWVVCLRLSILFSCIRLEYICERIALITIHVGPKIDKHNVFLPIDEWIFLC
jgi:hypothetical protein